MVLDFIRNNANHFTWNAYSLLNYVFDHTFSALQYFTHRTRKLSKYLAEDVIPT